MSDRLRAADWVIDRHESVAQMRHLVAETPLS